MSGTMPGEHLPGGWLFRRTWAVLGTLAVVATVYLSLEGPWPAGPPATRAVASGSAAADGIAAPEERGVPPGGVRNPGAWAGRPEARLAGYESLEEEFVELRMTLNGLYLFGPASRAAEARKVLVWALIGVAFAVLAEVVRLPRWERMIAVAPAMVLGYEFLLLAEPHLAAGFLVLVALGFAATGSVPVRIALASAYDRVRHRAPHRGSAS